MYIDNKSRFYNTEDILNGLEHIEKLLNRDGTKGPEHSGFIALKTACYVYKNQLESPLGIDFRLGIIRELIVYIVGAMDLVRYVSLVKKNKNLKKLKEHFNYVGIGGFGLSSTLYIIDSNTNKLEEYIDSYVTKKIPPEARKDAARKTFELMLALSALNAFEDTKIETEDSKQMMNNPDLLFSFQGHRYGIACKSISTYNREGVVERIVEGIKQIDRAARSGSINKGRGVVFVDISSLLDHKKLYCPNGNNIWTLESTSEVIKDSILYTMSSIFEESKGSDWQSVLGPLFRDSAAAPIVLIYGHAVMLAVGESETTIPTLTKCMTVLTAGDNSKVNQMCDRLNKAIHCLELGD